MSTHASRDPAFHEGGRKPAYVAIGIAIMMSCCLITIFVIDAQGTCPPPWPSSGPQCPLFGSYAGWTNYPYLELEGAGVIWAGALVSYFVFIWRSATRGYSYKSW